MAEWRYLSGWSEAELERRFDALATLERSFTESEHEMTPERGWTRLHSGAPISHEIKGPPHAGGAFERAREFMVEYGFSDPRIVTSHFDPKAPLLGRRMLLELKVMGLRYLSGTVVDAVKSESQADRTVFAYRYSTLQGHIESGAEWFVLDKDHATGCVRFSIHAMWRKGELPNWWSELGFRMFARRYQRAWHRLAYLRLRAMLGSEGLPPVPHGDRLVHEGRVLPLPGVQRVAGAYAPVDAPEELEERGTT